MKSGSLNFVYLRESIAKQAAKCSSIASIQTLR